MTAAASQAAVGYTKGGSIGSSDSHVWGRCSDDPRHWIVIPTRLADPVFRAVPDDFGQLVPVETVQ